MQGILISGNSLKNRSSFSFWKQKQARQQKHNLRMLHECVYVVYVGMCLCLCVTYLHGVRIAQFLLLRPIPSLKKWGMRYRGTMHQDDKKKIWATNFKNIHKSISSCTQESHEIFFLSLHQQNRKLWCILMVIQVVWAQNKCKCTPLIGTFWVLRVHLCLFSQL